MSSEGNTGRSWAGLGAEGLVIVLSILLALGAEAAWSYRSDRADEQRLLEGLAVEFEEVEFELAADFESRNDVLARLRMATEAEPSTAFGPDSARVIVSALLDWRFYTPGHAILDDAISSGRLDLIRSDAVRRSLMQYVQQRERIGVFDARERDFVAEQMEPFLAERVPLDALSATATATPGAADLERFRSLLSDPTFHSLLQLRKHRTEEANTFSDLVARAARGVREALDREM